jgi:hypothetical protein
MGPLPLLKRLGAVVWVPSPKDKDAALPKNVFLHRSSPASYYKLSPCALSLQKVISQCWPLERVCPKANPQNMAKHVAGYMEWIEAFVALSGLGGSAPSAPKASGGGAPTPGSSGKPRGSGSGSGSGSKERGDYCKKHVLRKHLITTTLRMEDQLPTDGDSEKASGQSHALSL